MCFSTKHYISKSLMSSHKKHFNSSNYKTSLYNLFACLYTKKYQRSSCVFPQNTPFQNPHVFSQQNTSIRVTIKPVYTTYLCVFTQKIPKILMCFFTKHSISKSSCVLTTKHFNSSNYKTCLYNLFVCLYTKNTKDPHVFFTKHYISKSPCVLTKTLQFE